MFCALRSICQTDQLFKTGDMHGREMLWFVYGLCLLEFVVGLWSDDCCSMIPRFIRRTEEEGSISHHWLALRLFCFFPFDAGPLFLLLFPEKDTALLTG